MPPKAQNLASLKMVALPAYNEIDLSSNQKAGPRIEAAYQKKQRLKRKLQRPDLLSLPIGSKELVRAKYYEKYANRSGNHKQRIAKYLLLLHFIFHKQQRSGYTRQDFIGLYCEILKRVIGAHKALGRFSYTQVREDLIAWGIIEHDPAFFYARQADAKTKNFSTSYRFTPEFQCDAEIIEVKGLKYQQQTKDDRKKRQKEKNRAAGLEVRETDEEAPHIQWLKEAYLRVGFAPEIYNLINEMERKKAPLPDKKVKIKGRSVYRTGRFVTPEIANSYRHMVNEMLRQQENRTPEFSFSLTNGRLNTIITRSFTKSRQFITIYGKRVKLADLDLACSQVFLLLRKLYNTQAAKESDETDLDEFADTVLKPGFYQNLAYFLEALHSDLGVIDSPKTSFFTNVIYSKNHALTPYRRAFNEEYPTVHTALMELVTMESEPDENGETTLKFRNLAVMLQQEESDLFLHQMVPKIHQALGHEATILTVHDSFLCEAKDLEIVRAIMTSVLLDATGFTPTILTSEEKKLLKEAKEEVTAPITKPVAQLLLDTAVVDKATSEILKATYLEVNGGQQATISEEELHELVTADGPYIVKMWAENEYGEEVEEEFLQTLDFSADGYPFFRHTAIKTA